MHSVHFHGQILTAQNHHTDTISLFPASSTTAEMVADNPGKWLLTCDVNDHMMGELTASFLNQRFIVSQSEFDSSRCLVLYTVVSYCCVAFFPQLECRLYLRSRSVSLMYISLGHTVNSDSSSLLQKRKFGTMHQHAPLMGQLLYTQ